MAGLNVADRAASFSKDFWPRHKGKAIANSGTNQLEAYGISDDEATKFLADEQTAIKPVSLAVGLLIRCGRSSGG